LQLGRNITAFSASANTLFLKKPIEQALKIWRGVGEKGRKRGEREEKRVRENTKKGEQLCGCSPFFYHIKTSR